MPRELKLTDDEKSYLQRMFLDHSEKIDKKLDQELAILSKYKGELARNFESAGAHHNTLIGCMKDLLNRQDELIGLCNQLGDFVNRIEQLYLTNFTPKLTQEAEHE